MLKLGLTSVTFRELSAESIIEYCKECGLCAVEWGSDVHVPPGDIAAAKAVSEKMQISGIAVSSYGSYYIAGSGEDFVSYAKSAAALGAPVIRVWGGEKNFDELAPDEYARILADVKAICRTARKYGCEIAFEYHNDSLTSTAQSALRVMADANEPNLGMYFQYDPWTSVDENYAALLSLLPYLKTVHIFNVDDKVNRYSLAEAGGIDLWRGFCKILTENNADVYMLFEFLKDASLAGLKTESEIMQKIIRDCEAGKI